MKPQRFKKLVQILLAVLALAAARPGAAQVAPTAAVFPAPDSIVPELQFLHVVFDVSVIGVEASDLLINGSAASDVVTNNPNDYTFHFPQPPSGPVQVEWLASHGITDTTPQANPFGGGSWSYTLDTNFLTQVVISEFLTDNVSGIKDDDGSRQDWIELFNSGAVQANLAGWFLTDTPTNLTKWQIPAAAPSLQANGYMLIWASAKDRTNPVAPLHTNFKLSKSAGSYLALVDPNTNVLSAFDPYPAQTSDVSYGRDPVDPTLVGFFSTPTPGKRNSATGSGLMPAPIFSVDSGLYTNDSLTLTITASNAPPGSIIRYTTKINVTGIGASAAVSVPDTTAGSQVYTGAITFRTNLLIKARVFPPAGTNLFPGPILARNYIFLDATNNLQTFSSPLPLLIISMQGQGIPDSLVPGAIRPEGTLAVINTVNGRSSVRGEPDYFGPAGFEVYGQTSAGFVKKPIRIETHDAVGNDFNAPLLGLPSDSDWKLRNPFDDKTYLNDFLGYELFEKMGNYSCRRRLVEVFIDTGGGRLTYPADYYGIMVLFESIKAGNNRVDIPQLTPFNTTEPAITGGYIFAYDKDSTGDLNFTAPGGGGFGGHTLKLHEPKPNSLRTGQGVTTSWPGAGYTAAGSNQMGYLTRYLAQMEKTMYAANWLAPTNVGTTNHWTYYMDANSFADFQLLVEFTKQIDGVRLSSYFTKDRSPCTNCPGRLKAGPVWDWNLSFGNADYLDGGHYSGWYYDEMGEEDIWLRRLVSGTTSAATASGDPDFTQKITDRWSIFRTNVLNGTNVLKRIDELSTLLAEPADRDAWGPNGKYRSALVGVYNWPNPTGPPTWDIDYTHPLKYLGSDSNSIIWNMKKWTLGRFLWMDGNFTPVPTLSAPGGQVSSGSTITITPPPGTTLYYTLDGSDPRMLATTNSPGGTISPNAFTSNGPARVTVTSNVRIVARAKGPNGWKNTFSGPNAATFVIQLPSLRITEIMYNPLAPTPGGPYTSSDFEYIEVTNAGGTPLSVNQFTLSGGIDFTFPNIILSVGQSAVIVANVAAFQSRYGTGVNVIGTFTGHLGNGGDHVALIGALQETIQDFSYNNSWYPATDGNGFSLVAVDAPANGGNSASDWRPSSKVGGSPGEVDPLLTSPRPAVLVNEALTNEDPAAGDAIELYNSTGAPADISGWFLTDDLATPKKYAVPPNTPPIPAGGFMVFYGTNSFDATNAFNANGTNAFGLGGNGDQLYVFSGDGTNLTGYAHGFDFGPAEQDVTFGRYITSSGASHFVAQKSATLGSLNSLPLVGPVVLSEINYHPPDIIANNIGYDNPADEFIELQNLSAFPVPLYDPAHQTNSWQLQNAVQYAFPANAILPAGGFLLVVGFDPAADAAATAAFRARNFVPDALPLYGPWRQGQHLDNVSAAIELVKPGVPATNGVPLILVERVKYSNTAPWPPGGDGFGLTLQRVVASSYGDDATNWVAVAPSPGAVFVAGGIQPVITAQPSDQVIVAGTSVLLSAGASGTAPVRFQWRFNGANIYGANASTLLLTNFGLSASSPVGAYSVFAYNSGGYAIGTNFLLTSRIGLKITSHPVSRVATNGGSTNFTVFAVGTGTLRYQWRFNGGNILNATNASPTNNGISTLVVSNITVASQGAYDCVVSGDLDPSLTTQPATLTIIYVPVFTSQPISQTVLAGGSASFSCSATGTFPITFTWRKSVFGTLTNNSPNAVTVSASSYSSLKLINLDPTKDTNVLVTVTNIAGVALGGAPLGRSLTAFLTYLADTDGDGLPDVFQAAHPGVIGAGDEDHDGMINKDEYFAGTDPFDASSNLKLSGNAGPAGTLQFNAVSNRTYTVQYTDRLNPTQWKKLADVLARNVTRIETVPDPSPRTNRIYRIVTPIQP